MTIGVPRASSRPGMTWIWCSKSAATHCGAAGGCDGRFQYRLLKGGRAVSCSPDAGRPHGGLSHRWKCGASRKTLNRLGQAVLVAVESGHPQACVLPDVYHMYKGGSDFGGLKLLSSAAVHVFHMNDYPATPPRQTISDKDRVYPGDGIAPLADIMRTLRAIDFNGYLSIELFNPDYWRRDPLQVASAPQNAGVDA